MYAKDIFYIFLNLGNMFSFNGICNTVVSALAHAPRERQKACAKANLALRGIY